MESYAITSLPPLFDPLSSQLSKKLPEFSPLFFFPPLEDRPQNPIVEALVESSSSSSSVPQLAGHEEEDDISAASSGAAEGHQQAGESVVGDCATDIWAAKEVISETRAAKVRHYSLLATLSRDGHWHHSRTKISHGTRCALLFHRSLPRRRSYLSSPTMSSMLRDTCTHLRALCYPRCLHNLSLLQQCPAPLERPFIAASIHPTFGAYGAFTDQLGRQFILVIYMGPERRTACLLWGERRLEAGGHYRRLGRCCE